MRAYLPAYELLLPATLNEALDVLARDNGTWKPFAGGTDLMVLLEAGKLPHKNYVNLWNLKELRGIEVTNDQVVLGALTTYTELQNHPVLRTEFPMLCEAARETGGIAIQNRGTLGGNIVNASPAADSPPALLVYDAELELVSTRGPRLLPYAQFHTGYKQMNIGPDELLARIRLPRTTGDLKTYYLKVVTRKAQAISKVCFAAGARVNDGRIADIRIALGSVAPTVVRCTRTEESLREQKIDEATIKAARTALLKEITPIDDMRSTAAYRQSVAANLLADFLRQLEHA